MIKSMLAMYLLLMLPFIPQERELPPGEVCATQADGPKVHACECHRICTVGEDGTHHMQEDRNCLVYCNQHQCTCAYEACCDDGS